MGFFDQVLDFGKSIAAPVLGYFSGGPMGAVTATSNLSVAKSRPPVLERSGSQMFPGDPGIMRGEIGLANSGNTSFFGGLGQAALDVSKGIGDFAQNISPLANMFGSPVPSRFLSTGPAISIDTGRPQETSTSGEILGANLGLGNLLLQGGRRFIGSPIGQGVIGGASALALSGSGSGGARGPRITRKMKSDVRRIYMMTGMNPQATADILNSMGTYPNISFNADVVFFILLKRFRNDGPVVTKAAVRKTRQTLRRMKGVVDMYNSTCKPTTRRAPMRRAAPKAVQLIKN